MSAPGLVVTDAEDGPGRLRAPALVTAARCLAVWAHQDQRYGDLLYLVHLSAVEFVLLRFGYSSVEMRVAAWLHDVLEDTDVTSDLLRESFPERVAVLVEAVTNSPGRNRHERHIATYPRILAAGPDAVALKLADRIANAEVSRKSGSALLFMYKHEHDFFKKSLYTPGVAEDMWSYLDTLLA